MKRALVFILSLGVVLSASGQNNGYPLTPGNAGGSTIPSTTNVITGNGSGNGADSGVPITDAAFTNEVSIESYASFAGAITAIGSSQKTLVIPSTKAVSTTVTVPATCQLKFTGAGKLTVAANQTLTLARRPVAPVTQQIFDVSASGSIAKITQADGLLPLRWWGLKADGTTDDAPIIQSAINGVTHDQHFQLPDESTTIIRSTIKIYGLDGVGIIGSSGRPGQDHQTQMVWDGASGQYMIDCENAEYPYFNGFWMKLDNGGNIAAGAINFDQHSAISAVIVSMTSGTNALTTSGGALRGNMIGDNISIPGAGAAGATLVTTISGFTDFNHITTTANASTTVSSGTASVSSGITVGTMTGAIVENMRFTNQRQNSNFVMLRTAYYSGQNCEFFQIKNCIFTQGYNNGVQSDYTRGTAISFGDSVGGGGGNTFSELIEDCVMSEYAYCVKAQSTSGSIHRVHSENSGTDFYLNGSRWEVTECRPETDLQFAVVSDGVYHFRKNEIDGGDYTGVVPTIESIGNGAITIQTNYFANFSSAIRVKATNSHGQATLVSEGNSYGASLATTRPGLATFASYRTTNDFVGIDERGGWGGVGASASTGSLNAGIWSVTNIGSTPSGYLDGSIQYFSDGVEGSNPANFNLGGTHGALGVKVAGSWELLPSLIAPNQWTGVNDFTGTGGGIKINAIANQTSNGYIKLSGGVGTISIVSVPIPYTDGGTGATSLTNHGAVVAGSSALSTVAPGTAGNVFTSNGSDWISSAASAGGVTAYPTLGKGTATHTYNASDGTDNTSKIGVLPALCKFVGSNASDFAGRANYVPFFVSSTTTFTKVVYYVSANNNGSGSRLAFYSADSATGLPLTRLTAVETGLSVASTGWGTYTLANPVTITGGSWFWVGFATSATTNFATVDCTIATAMLCGMIPTTGSTGAPAAADGLVDLSVSYGSLFPSTQSGTNLNFGTDTSYYTAHSPMLVLQ